MRTDEFLEYLRGYPATTSLGESIATIREARRMRCLVPAMVPVDSDPSASGASRAERGASMSSPTPQSAVAEAREEPASARTEN